MKKDYNLIMKCRAIFIRSTAILLGGDFLYDGRFEILLKYFFDSYVYIVPQIFDLIYDVRTKKDGEIYIYETNEMRRLFFEKLKDCNSNYVLGKMCDEVGEENTKLMSRLAELFYTYILDVETVDYARNRILN